MPPSAINLIDLAKLAVDFNSTPPASERTSTEEAPSVTLVPWSLKICMVEVVPPSAVILTALARLAVERIPTPPASDKIVTDSAPSVTELP